MMRLNVLFDSLVLAAWSIRLISIEWAALIMGVIGCCTGIYALYRATVALTVLDEMKRTEEVVRELKHTADVIESKITDS